MMQLQHIDNLTPFEWSLSCKMAPRQRLCDVVIVKCSLPLVPSLERANCLPEQARPSPPHPADMARASDLDAYAPLRVAGDTVLYKPATDLLLSGQIQPPKDKQTAWPIQINIKTATELRQQTLVLHAPRQWRWSLLGGWQLVYTDSVASAPIALQYELAFGGSYRDKDEWHYHPINPAGKGWLPSHRIDTHVYYDAAQIEIDGSPLTRIGKAISIPALGPIARAWDLRSQYAGTYGEAWEEQTPHPQFGRDYPPDFDLRFFQAAAPAMVFSPHWTGGEAIEILGLPQQPALYARMPHWSPELALQGTNSKQPHVARMLLDTVELDLDARRVHLLWRSSLPQEQGWQYAVIGLSRDGPSTTHHR